MSAIWLVLPGVLLLAACGSTASQDFISATVARGPGEAASATDEARRKQELDTAIGRELEAAAALRSAGAAESRSVRAAALTTGSTGPLTDIPRFEWPPPKPSGRVEIPARLLLASEQRTTLGAAARRLRLAMTQAGYGEHSVYRINANGIALVTRLERLKADGSPDPDARWQAPDASQPFSLFRFLRGLVWSEPGHYRLIVLALTSDALPGGGRPLLSGDVPALQTGGLASLPKALADLPYTREHSGFALIYEFRREHPDAEPALLDPGRFTALQHLQKAAIWAALENAPVAEIAGAN